MKPVAGPIAVGTGEPHVTALKLELRDRKWAYAAIPSAAFVEQRLGISNLSEIGMDRCQRGQTLEVSVPLLSCLAQAPRLFISPHSLQDSRRFHIQLAALQTQPLGCLEIGQRFDETVQAASRPCACQKRQSVGRCAVDLSLGQHLCALVVGDTTQDLGTEHDEIDQRGPGLARLRSPGRLLLEPLDVRLQVVERNRAVRRTDLNGVKRREHQVGIPTNGASLGGMGLGLDRYGKVSGAGAVFRSTPSEIRGPLPLLMRIVRSESTMS